MKKIKQICCLILLPQIFSISFTFPEFIENPDENTLWIEDGKEIEVAEKSGKGVWRESLQIVPRKEGGFSIIYNPEEEEAYATEVWVPLSQEYKYWVVQIDSFSRVNYPSRSFYMGNLYQKKCLTFIMIDNPQPGLMVWPIYNDESKWDSAAGASHRIDNRGLKVDFAFIKMVKIPDYYITIESETMTENNELKIGDKIKFTVIMQKGAEDVSIRLYDNYCMPLMKINDLEVLQLKPEKRKGTADDSIWSATVVINKLSNNLRKSNVQILAKASVLGGGIKIPIWTPFPYLYLKK